MSELKEEIRGWIAIANSKKAQNFEFIALSFERVEKGEKGGVGGGSPLLITRKFRTLSLETTRELKALSFERVERGKRGMDHHHQKWESLDL